MSWINKAQDNRSGYTFKSDFEKGTEIEQRVMIALKNYYLLKGIDCEFEKIGEDVFLDEIKHDEPDYYFHKGDQVHTIEIKFSFTGRFKDNTIAIRPGAVINMRNNPLVYPNGKVLIATNEKFASINQEDLTNYEYFKPWSKKCFTLNPDELDWFRWIEPLKDSLPSHYI